MVSKEHTENPVGSHNDYFSKLNALLKEQGPGHPVIVLDLDTLDQNISELKKRITAPKSFRVVVKSMPCIELIRHVFKKAETRKAMVFHRPFLNLLAQELPDANVLLGKPFPVRAAKVFYQELEDSSDFDPASNIQWLIDTHHRLLQYRQLACDLDTRLCINIEIDVGLHRGGLSQPEKLRSLLQTIKDDPIHLSFSGYMGYDPHVSKSEKLFIPKQKALTRVLKRYEQFIAFVKSEFPDLYSDRLTFNGAGSPTYTYYESIDLLNDISVGSALLKPGDFDLDNLGNHQPAMFIATPILKKHKGLIIPFLEPLAPVMKKLKRSWDTTFFIYGGYWKAVPHSPKGLVTNSFYGRSTNQEMLNAPEGIAVDVDDYIFLRPTQSESVMLQFGDLVVVQKSEIVGRWPVFSQGS